MWSTVSWNCCSLLAISAQNVEQGSIAVAVEPCNADSSALDDDFFVEDPDQLMGKPFHFKVSAAGLA